MKKIYLALFVSILFSAQNTYAQMDNLTNMSAEWMRTSNRNAALDATDIVVYNPAGLVKMSDGLHINLSNQTLIRQPQHTFDLGFGKGEQTFKQDKIDPVLPNLYLAYKKNNWAIHGGIYIPGGGATANYPDGSLTTELISTSILLKSQMQGADYSNVSNQSLKASSYYIAFALGGSYAINDVFSVSFGGRYLTCNNTTKAGMTLTGSQILDDESFKVETEDNAGGFGGVIGLNIQPFEKLNIGIKYETAVNLDFKTDVKKDDLGMFIDGAKSRRDLPSNFNIGFAYKVTDKFTAELDYGYYFQRMADWGRTKDTALFPTSKKWSEMAGDCYIVGLAFIYNPSPKLTLSAGTAFTKFMYDDKEGYYTSLGSFEVLKNDNWNFSIGGAYEIFKGINLNLALGYCLWKDYEIKSLQVESLKYATQNPYTNTTVKTQDNATFIAVGFDINL